ncbi:hypothetical protein Y032_0394g620 [Ancylostoma ceylanicum]|uniref:Intraflagellar transport protein 122 homolog n=1 Tax=Ancylostoma ceylanicum TaxID=53326 RepID=A0A016RRS7_9BILA|nr:hypothetical protein Y032_0394g620 [Ancylostoma ceylanicum]
MGNFTGAFNPWETKARHCVYDLAFKPDGSELLVAADNKVIIYDGIDGTLLQVLKGHKDLVYAVAWSHDGETFASGSADRSVILWTEQHEGTLKYSHSDAIQCLAFSPVTSLLLSCAMGDFGLWSADEKNVQKQRITGRCSSCAWSRDGSIFAIGTHDGFVHIKKSGNFQSDEYVAKIERPGGEPVWALRFCAPRPQDDGSRRFYDNEPSSEVLVVTDWNRRVGFYDPEGNPVKRDDMVLNYDPTCVEFIPSGQFLLIGGSGRQVTLHTRLGTEIGTVAQMDTWVWCIRVRPVSNPSTVVVGCVDGTIACYNLMFSTIHGLHKERYAFRDNMTDVVVQHLIHHTMTRIRCHDLVKKVAIYGHKLAVQLSDRLHIYRQIKGDGENEQLEYTLSERINKAFDCSLLVVCSNHLILCDERRLQCYDHKGLKQREWQLESAIRYIKVIGGPPGRETILIGLREGQVCKLFVDNPFPVQVLKLNGPIKCIDISVTRRHIAVVDDSGLCVVFDANTKEVLFEEPNCNSVAFNNDNEEIICYSGNSKLTVRARGYPGHQQRMFGFVVGFSGNKVYCLHIYAMQAIEVPFSNQLYQYIENKDYQKAYDLACLGVTSEDWQILAKDAIANLQCEIAKKAFARYKDYRSLQLVHEIKEMMAANEPEYIVRAHVLCYEGKFQEAAALYRANGDDNRAMQLFTDLRMFDEAQEVMASASGETQRMLMRKRADWARNSNQPKIAAEMLISSGDLDKAVQLITENDWMDLAINVMRKLERSDVDSLRRLASYFIRKSEFNLAARIYGNINDIKAMAQMHVAAGHWTDAFAIADRYPKFVEDVYLPYARHLAERDQFLEAQKAYHKAGRDQEALRVLEQLTGNAVDENRFADAGYYHWLLSMQYLERSKDNPSLIPKYHASAKLADVYYAYDAIFLYCNQPFTRHSPETLLNMARYLSAQEPVPNISQVLINYTMARIGRELGAYKLARDTLDRLGNLRVPPRLQRDVELMTVNIRAKPFSDAEDLLPVCHRCGLNNPLTCGMNCVHCKTAFEHSFATFEILPLIEFTVDEDIPTEEAVSLVESEPPLSDSNFNPFQNVSKKSTDVRLNRDDLTRLEKGQVIILHLPAPLKTRFLFNQMPSISVSKCPSCNKVFHSDDFEMAVLQEGHCPYCRSVQERVDNPYALDES